MGLDIYFFKRDVDFQDNRNKRDELQTKFQAIKNKIEQIEDDYKHAKLFSTSITHNLSEIPRLIIEANA